MTSPYLERPLVPLTVALPRMLETIEIELAREPRAAEKWRLRQRAELVRGLLRQSTPSKFAARPVGHRPVSAWP